MASVSRAWTSEIDCLYHGTEMIIAIEVAQPDFQWWDIIDVEIYAFSRFNSLVTRDEGI